jgi:non-ribosomal peptide synthetase component F
MLPSVNRSSAPGRHRGWRSISFDAATLDVWGALLIGAWLVVLPSAMVLEPQAFAARLQAEWVTTLFVTTALFNTLGQTAPDAFRSLRQVLFGGEAVEPHWVRQVKQSGASARGSVVSRLILTETMMVKK